ncbi:hypothetical protein D9M68_925520 [compost metagenome]
MMEVGGFRGGAMGCGVQAFLFAAGVLLLHCLLAVVIDGQIAHDPEDVVDLGFQWQGNLLHVCQPEEGILNDILGSAVAAGDAGCGLDQGRAVLHQRL